MARRERGQPLPPGFGTIWTTVAVDLLGFGIILPVLPLYVERFGAGPITVGLLVASFSLANFVCAPILGRWSDKVGRKPVILVSLFGTAVGSFVTGAAVGVWMLFVGRLLDGASGASVSVAQGAVADVAAPQDRARLLGLLSAAFGVGFVLGPALGGLAALAGERVPFYAAGTLALVNGLVALRRLPETHPRLRPPPTPVTASGRGAAGELRRLVMVFFVSVAAFSAFEATFALFGERRFDLTEGSVAAVFVGIGITLVAVQTLLVRRVVERLGNLGTLRVGLACTALALALLSAATTWWLLVPVLVVLVVGQGLAGPSLSASVADRSAQERRGRAFGVQQSAGSLARIVGPAAAGLLFHWAVPLPSLVGAVLVLVALALTATLSPSVARTPG
jgi:multidrug resistance protein